jgi:hypothetical protein
MLGLSTIMFEAKRKFVSELFQAEAVEAWQRLAGLGA